MKETAKSLKIYFIILGIATFYNIFSNYGVIFQNVLLSIIGLISVLWGLLYFYLGIKFYYFLYNKTKLLINIVIAGLAYLLILSIVFLFFLPPAAIILVALVGLVLNLYIIKNIKRLAQPPEPIKEPIPKAFSLKRIFIATFLTIVIVIIIFAILIAIF